MLTILKISPKAIEPVEIKCHEESAEVEETKICSNDSGHMTNMATTLIYG